MGHYTLLSVQCQTFYRTFEVKDSIRNTSANTAVTSGVATPGDTRAFAQASLLFAWAFAQASLLFAQASENVVHTGTDENTAFYNIKCSPYHQHTPDIATPYASYTFKSCSAVHYSIRTSPKLTRDFSLQRLFCHVSAHALLLLELFTDQIVPLFYSRWLL